MPAERAAHWKAKSNVALWLREAITRAGLPCHAFPDGPTVRITPRTAYEPDALVYCGPEVDDKSFEVPNPVIIVEALSPSNRATDIKIKLPGYFSLPSVQHYLIVDADRKHVIHHRRTDGDPLRRVIEHGDIVLDPPGITITVAEIFS